MHVPTLLTADSSPQETSEEPADSEDIQSMLNHQGLKNISALENFVAQAQLDQNKLNELEAEYAKLEEAEKQQMQRCGLCISSQSSL